MASDHRTRARLRADADPSRPCLDAASQLHPAWNEAFWTLNLSTLDAAPLTVSSRPIQSEGVRASLRAASTLRHCSIIHHSMSPAGKLVRGLTFGAVK